MNMFPNLYHICLCVDILNIYHLKQKSLQFWTFETVWMISYACCFLSKIKFLPQFCILFCSVITIKVCCIKPYTICSKSDWLWGLWFLIKISVLHNFSQPTNRKSLYWQYLLHLHETVFILTVESPFKVSWFIVIVISFCGHYLSSI